MCLVFLQNIIWFKILLLINISYKITDLFVKMILANLQIFCLIWKRFLWTTALMPVESDMLTIKLLCCSLKLRSVNHRWCFFDNKDWESIRPRIQKLFLISMKYLYSYQYFSKKFLRKKNLESLLNSLPQQLLLCECPLFPNWKVYWSDQAYFWKSRHILLS